MTLGEFTFTHPGMVKYALVEDSVGEYLCALSDHDRAVEYWNCQVLDYDCATVKVIAF